VEVPIVVSWSMASRVVALGVGREAASSRQESG